MYQTVLHLHIGCSQTTGARNQALEFSQIPLHVKDENIAKSMIARRCLRKMF